MTIALRPNWHKNVGPGSMPMPDDGVGHALAGPFPQIHEDPQDCINADGTHGPENVGEPGGSGIVMGYSVQDPENVVALDAAVHKRTNWYNYEHWIRQIRYALARSDMTRDLSATRRVLEYANHAQQDFDGGSFYYDGPGWTPATFAQWLHQAQMHPHTGLPGAGIPGGSFNARAAGWVLYGEAAALKVHPARSPAFAHKMLDTFALAAIPGTGQIIRDANTGGGPLDSVDVQHTDHWAIAAHATMCACRRLGRPAPQWVIDGMWQLLNQVPTTYGGWPSPWCFQRSVDSKLVPATGSGQQPAPAHGWWSTNCAVLSVMDDPAWKLRAAKFGPQVAADEQSRKQTMLMRGLA